MQEDLYFSQRKSFDVPTGVIALRREKPFTQDLEMSELVTQEVYKIGGGGATQAKRGS
jgi:hypothetical protein